MGLIAKLDSSFKILHLSSKSTYQRRQTSTARRRALAGYSTIQLPYNPPTLRTLASTCLSLETPTQTSRAVDSSVQASSSSRPREDRRSSATLPLTRLRKEASLPISNSSSNRIAILLLDPCRLDLERPHQAHWAHSLSASLRNPVSMLLASTPPPAPIRARKKQ